MTKPTKPTAAGERAEELQARQVQSVMRAVAKLPLQFPDFAAEAIFEGAMKGAAVQLIARTGVGAGDVANLLEHLARAFREDGDLIDGRPN